MAIIRWSPWNLSQLLDEDFELPASLARMGLGQGLNLYETEDAVVAEAAVPGVPEDRIDITVEGRVVRVNASREEKQEERGKRRYFMSTMSESNSYSFRLPESVSPDQEPMAEVNDGVLTMTFSKMQKEPPKKIKVTKKQKEAGKK